LAPEKEAAMKGALLKFCGGIAVLAVIVIVGARQAGTPPLSRGAALQAEPATQSDSIMEELPSVCDPVGGQSSSANGRQPISPSVGANFTVRVTDEDGKVSDVDDFSAVYEPAEWVSPRPQTNRLALSLVLQTTTGSERLIEVPFAEIKRIDFEPAYSDPEATGSVPAWYPVRITKLDGSLLVVARGPRCVICDAAGRAVESIPLSDELRVYDRSNGYAERGYVFRAGSQSGVTAVGLYRVATPLLLTGFTGRRAGESFYIRYGPTNNVRSIELQ
jgi:hypothetical protein